MRFPIIALVVLSIALLALAFIIPGTGGDGDSVMHYLFAHHAFEHPANFFNHWAKPLFTLLASPFAYFGFTGMKVFNVLVAITTVIITYKSAKDLGLPHPMLAAGLLFLIPMYTVWIFSGLTEPLFALGVIAVVFLSIRQRWIAAACLLSFLPFVRSEGILLILVYGVYLIIEKKWRLIPLLIVGHAVYGVVGLIQYDTVLWPFTRIPYVGHGNYGSGDLTHFIVKLLYITGIPVFVLFWTGFIALIWKFLSRRYKEPTISPEVMLIYGFTVTYIVAHSLFWWLGIFHSMGLPRVLIGVAPLIALIAARGVELIWRLLPHQTLRTVWIGMVILSASIFPFSNNKATPKVELWQLDETQRAFHILGDKYRKEDAQYLYSAPYAAIGFDINHFDKNQHRRDWHSLKFDTVRNTYIIWDWWFSPTESGIDLSTLQRTKQIEDVERVNRESDGKPLVVVFKSKD
ncbi:MAG: hypothetical protein Salg2KO_03370 [Salibacteraceae bacterium]